MTLKSQTYSCSKHNFCLPWWCIGFVFFLTKMNMLMGLWELLIGDYFVLCGLLVIFVSHNLWMRKQMVLLWTHYCGRTLAINILMPSLSSLWSGSPWWPDTKEISGKIFTPDQVINRKKSRSEQQTVLVTTDQPRIAPNSAGTNWKRGYSAWISMWIMSMTCLINESLALFVQLTRQKK